MSLVCFIQSKDEDLSLPPHAALLFVGDVEDGWDELGPSMDDVVGDHLTHFKLWSLYNTNRNFLEYNFGGRRSFSGGGGG